jgi:hypothetical protein
VKRKNKITSNIAAATNYIVYDQEKIHKKNRAKIQGKMSKVKKKKINYAHKAVNKRKFNNKKKAE